MVGRLIGRTSRLLENMRRCIFLFVCFFYADVMESRARTKHTSSSFLSINQQQDLLLLLLLCHLRHLRQLRRLLLALLLPANLSHTPSPVAVVSVLIYKYFFCLCVSLIADFFSVCIRGLFRIQVHRQ